MTKKQEKSVYLPGLNALRFFAAFLVIVTHVELLKQQLGFPSVWNLLEKFNLGGLGVYFFFVLSGYLITYLLIDEREKTGTVNIKAFYVRRLLRIWPLYYLITFLSFFVFPHVDFMHVTWLQQFFAENYEVNILLFLTMLPNLAFAINPAVPHAGHLWSIGVEEQFYLIWPVLFKRTKNLGRLLFTILTVVLVVKVAFVLLLVQGVIPQTSGMLALKKFLAMSKFECMAIGAIGAYWIKYDKQRVLSIIYNKVVLWGSIILLPLMNYFSPEKLNDGIHLPYSIVFIILIMNISLNGVGLRYLENRMFNFLGKISYGLYMYHMFMVVIIIKVITYFQPKITLLVNFEIYIGSILATIFVAWLSYEYFEKPFLKFKRKFTIVKSGRI